MSEQAKQSATVRVRNVGGIEDTTVAIPEGVTVLAGRNASNRTSLLQALMAVLGSEDVSLKGDADEGSVELTLDGTTYTRQLRRRDGGVVFGGDPYLDDPSIADLFAFLLESNEARRAVTRATDLRELIMRPVDTDAIQAEIRRLKREQSRIDEELGELDDLKQERTDLERRRTELRDQIESKRDELDAAEAEIAAADAEVEDLESERTTLESNLEELRDKRSALERVRSDIDLQRESIESLEAERRELEAERDELAEATSDDPRDLEREIERLRERKETLETRVGELQDVIRFNEDSLEDEQPFEGALTDGASADGDTPTDRLVEDTVVCWTCGSEIDSERIENTLDRLRERRQEQLDALNDIEAELDDLRADRREREQRRKRLETVERKLEELDDELAERRSKLEARRDERERLGEEVASLESNIERLESGEFSDLLDLHKEANRLEFELERLESEFDEVTDRIDAVEERLAAEAELQERKAEVRNDLEDCRTRIERIEREATEAFDEHMAAVLDILGYDNLERIWIERVERNSGGRSDQRAFELHVVRRTATGAVYEDTIDHLSESEREVTGLVFALAGYLVHELYEKIPFMLLDSLEAIDSDRIADLVDYVAEYPRFLVVALLPEDAQSLDDEYARVTDI